MKIKSLLHFGLACLTCSALVITKPAAAQSATGKTTSEKIRWPDGKKLAISLSFDDARYSQVDSGTAVLDKYGVKATFYVVPASVEKRLEGWKKAVAAGHEIGNHTLSHPCTGNYAFSRRNALEDYTLKKMRYQLTECNNRIRELLGVNAQVFAYPCGQKFVGRGKNIRSYVPLVADLFISGRGWLDEAANDAAFCDLAQITGMEMDGKNFKEILSLIESAKETGAWLTLAGHEMASGGEQTTNLKMLEELMQYAQDPANGIWIAPVGVVAKYIRDQRGF